MNIVSLKINDTIFGETEKILLTIGISRNKYINDAIEYYNNIQRKKILEKRINVESKLVEEDSMVVLKDFEKIDFAV